MDLLRSATTWTVPSSTLSTCMPPVDTSASSDWFWRGIIAQKINPAFLLKPTTVHVLKENGTNLTTVPSSPPLLCCQKWWGRQEKGVAHDLLTVRSHSSLVYSALMTLYRGNLLLYKREGPGIIILASRLQVSAKEETLKSTLYASNL